MSPISGLNSRSCKSRLKQRGPVLVPESSDSCPYKFILGVSLLGEMVRMGSWAQCFSPSPPTHFILETQSLTEVREGWISRCHISCSVLGKLMDMSTGSQKDQIWLEDFRLGASKPTANNGRALIGTSLKIWGLTPVRVGETQYVSQPEGLTGGFSSDSCLLMLPGQGRQRNGEHVALTSPCLGRVTKSRVRDEIWIPRTRQGCESLFPSALLSA